MSSNFVIRKNTIEIKTERIIIHRNQVSCITYEPSFKESSGYCIVIWFRKTIKTQNGNDTNTYKSMFVYCEDYLPFVEWFDNDEQKFFETTLEKHKHTGHYLESFKHIVRDTCKCCREQLASVCERPEFNNDFFCDVCYDAKTALASLDKGEENEII